MAHPFITDAQATQKIQESYNDIVNSIGTGFQGAITIADTPTENGIYIPTEEGTYANAGGLEYDPTEGITYFIRTDGVWTKNVTPINFTPTGVVEEGNLEAVSGGEVDFALKSSKLTLEGFFLKMELGSISRVDGTDANIPGRCRSGYINVDGFKIENLGLGNFHVFFYDENENFIRRDTYDFSPKKEYKSIFKGKVRFVLDTDIISSVQLKISLFDNYNSVKREYQRVKPFDYGDLHLEQGSISAAEGLPTTVNSSMRVRTADFIDVDGFIIENHNDNYEYTYFMYSDGVYLGTSSWLSESKTTVKDFKGQIKVAFRDPDNAAINPFSDIEATIFIGKNIEVEVSDEVEVSNISRNRTVIITAHRGAYFGDIVPENTIHSVVLAKRMGYKVVECDVKKTLDGHYVVIHDNSINRTMRNADYTPISGTINVADKTLEELKSNYVFISSTPKFRTRILTVQEFTQVCRDLEITPMFDIKIPDFDYLDDIVKIVGDDFICFSTQKPVLQYARSISKCLCLLNSSSASGVIDFLDDLGGWCGFSTTNPNVLTEEFISELNEKGYESQASIFSGNNEVAALKKGATMLLSDYSINVSKPYFTQEIYSDDNGFSDFSTTGIITDGIVTLENGQNLSKTFSEQILYGGLAGDLFFKGSLNISINGSDYATISSEDLDLRHFSMRFRNSTPSIQITALQNSEIHFLNLKNSTF